MKSAAAFSFIPNEAEEPTVMDGVLRLKVQAPCDGIF